MSPALVPGDVVLDGPAKGNYHPGEIITFRHSAQTTGLVTHRVTDLQGGKVHTKGDANPTADVWDIRPDQVQGVFVMSVPYLGYLLFFLKQPAGIASVITGGLALMMFWSLLNPSTADKAEPKRARKRATAALQEDSDQAFPTSTSEPRKR
jgi:signal peptidase